MVANLVIVLATLAALAVLAETVLSDREKGRVASATAHIWNALDEMKRDSVQVWISRKRTRLWFFGLPIVGVVGFLFYALATHDPRFPITLSTVVSAILPMALACMLGFYFGLRIFARTGTFRMVLYSAGLLVIAVAPVSLSVRLLMAYKDAVILNEQPTLIGALLLIFFVGSGLFTGAMLIWWLCIASTALASVLAGPLLWVSELFFRRIAEHPKGPILALSAVAGSLAALAKIYAP